MTTHRADMLYGRQGGRWVADQAARPTADLLAEGQLVRCRCDCTNVSGLTWILVPKQVGSECHVCGSPMKSIPVKHRRA